MLHGCQGATTENSSNCQNISWLTVTCLSGTGKCRHIALGYKKACGSIGLPGELLISAIQPLTLAAQWPRSNPPTGFWRRGAKVILKPRDHLNYAPYISTKVKPFCPKTSWSGVKQLEMVSFQKELLLAMDNLMHLYHIGVKMWC